MEVLQSIAIILLLIFGIAGSVWVLKASMFNRKAVKASDFDDYLGLGVIKRYDGASIHSNKKYFLILSFFFTFAIIKVAIEIIDKDQEEIVIVANDEKFVQEIVDIPITEIPPPPPPAPKKVIQQIVFTEEEVEEEEEIEQVEEEEEDLCLDCEEEEIIEEEEEPVERIFDFVEQQPEPPGGRMGFAKWLMQGIGADLVSECGKQGRILVECVINSDGSVSQVNIKRGLCTRLDNRVKQLFQSSTWTPGRQQGRAVSSKYRFPVAIRY